MRDPKLLQQLVNLERAVTSAADAAITQNQPINEGITMTEPTTIAMYLAVNENGDSRMSWDSPSDAIDELRDNDGFEAARVVEIKVTLDLPVLETVNVAVTVPAQTETPAEVTAS